MPPTKTLDLGNGVKMDLVLIPAGIFRQGVESPDEPPMAPSVSIDKARYECFAGISILLLFLVFILVKFVRKRKGSFSLATFTIFILICAFCVHGGASWYKAIQDSNRFTELMVAHDRKVMRYENATPDEYPARTTTIPKPLYMSECEITLHQYTCVLSEDSADSPTTVFNEYAASWRSYNNAMEFCDRLSKRSNLRVRLPFESELEFACRAGSDTQYCNGDTEDDLNAVGWYQRNTNGQQQPVGKKAANKFGLFDMHGNLWEFCADTLESGKRVIRGGSVATHPLGCRSSVRGFVDPLLRRNDIGFRVVIPVE